MLSKFSNNAILAKARSMFGKRLCSNDYNELLRRQNVAEVATYLRDYTHYSEVLQQVDVQTIHRGRLEVLLRRNMFQHYIRLVKYDVSKDKGFYSFVTVRSEIDQILTAIRLINSGTISEYFVNMPSYIQERASFDFSALGSAQSYTHLLAIIKRTPYFKILDKFTPKGTDQIDVTACERALLTYFYNYVFEKIDKEYSGQAKKDLENLFIMKIDIYNFEVAFRMKRFFGSTAAEIEACLLPYQTPSRKIIQAMANASSREEVLDIAGQSKYFKGHDLDQMEFIETLIERADFKLGMKDIRFNTTPAVVLTAYMIIYTIELSNIINIVEGIRYGLDANDIKKLLIY